VYQVGLSLPGSYSNVGYEARMARRANNYRIFTAARTPVIYTYNGLSWLADVTVEVLIPASVVPDQTNISGDVGWSTRAKLTCVIAGDCLYNIPIVIALLPLPLKSECWKLFGITSFLMICTSPKGTSVSKPWDTWWCWMYIDCKITTNRKSCDSTTIIITTSGSVPHNHQLPIKKHSLQRSNVIILFTAWGILITLFI